MRQDRRDPMRGGCACHSPLPRAANQEFDSTDRKVTWRTSTSPTFAWQSKAISTAFSKRWSALLPRTLPTVDLPDDPRPPHRSRPDRSPSDVLSARSPRALLRAGTRDALCGGPDIGKVPVKGTHVLWGTESYGHTASSGDVGEAPVPGTARPSGLCPRCRQ